MKNTPFQKIPDAARTIGVSQYFLRTGCKAGTVPHIKSGTVYLINVDALRRRLEAESLAHTVAPLPEQEKVGGIE